MKLQSSLVFLLLCYITPSLVYSGATPLRDIAITGAGQQFTPPASTYGGVYQKPASAFVEPGLFRPAPLVETLHSEPPDQDGFLGRYTVLAKDIVYLLPVGVAAIGAIYLMPEEMSNWDRDTITINEAWDNWKENVTHWEWDRDDAWINLVGHPYFGSAYVVYARHYGYNNMESLLFSFAASFFYEVGLEGWVEPVSIQDVIITPLLGFALAEILLPLEERIKKNNNRLFHSALLGNISLFLIDPFGYAIRPVKSWVGRSKRLQEAELHLSPIWHEGSLFQLESAGGRASASPCYGLFLTVHF